MKTTKLRTIPNHIPMQSYCISIFQGKPGLLRPLCHEYSAAWVMAAELL